MVHCSKLVPVFVVSVSISGCHHPSDNVGLPGPQYSRPVALSKPKESPKPVLQVGAPLTAEPVKLMAADSCKEASRGAPAWVCAIAGAQSSTESKMLFGVGSHSTEKYAQARAVHTLDSAWRSYLRLLDLELYGRSIERSGKLPLPPWSGEGLPRAGVTFPERWMDGGNVFVQARVTLATVLEHQAKIAKSRDFQAASEKAYQRLVGHDVRKEADAIAGERLSVLQYAVGPMHTCAVLQDHTVACWGAGELGQLGVRVNESHATIPRRVLGLRDIKSVAIGGQTTCAVTNEGNVFCWGAGRFGQLGRGALEKGSDPWETPYSAKPVLIKGLSDIAQVSVGMSHVCALHQKGIVSCWGSGDHGALGIPASEEQTVVTVNGPERHEMRVRVESTPQRVPNLENIKQIAAEQSRTCAVKDDGRVLCWGEVLDRFGGAGQGDACGPMCVNTPIEIRGITSARRISLGDAYGCALLADRTVSCWGANESGQLARTGCEQGCLPALIHGANDIVGVAAGPRGACTVSERGVVMCWGQGRIFGPTSERMGHTLMPVPDDVAEIELYHSACVRAKLGGLYCWGQNLGGEIGDGTTLSVSTPYQVRELGKP